MGETRGLFIAQAGRRPAMYQVKQKKAPEAAVEGLAERKQEGLAPTQPKLWLPH